MNPRKGPVGMTLSGSLVRLSCAEGCVLKGSKEAASVFLRGRVDMFEENHMTMLI